MIACRRSSHSYLLRDPFGTSTRQWRESAPAIEPREHIHEWKGTDVLREFRDFVMRGNVVELAVAVIIGAAFGAVITAFTAAFITPLIALIGGKPDFGDLRYHDQRDDVPLRAVPQRADLVPDHRRGRVLLRRAAHEQAHGADQAPDEEPEAPSAEVATLIEIRDLIATQRGTGSV